MKAKWEHLDLLHLQQLFREKEDSLAAALINGASWDSMASERRTLTEIAVAIHQKVFPGQPFDHANFKYSRTAIADDTMRGNASLKHLKKQSFEGLLRLPLRIVIYSLNFFLSFLLYVFVHTFGAIYMLMRASKRKQVKLH